MLHRYWNNYTESVALKPLEKIAKALGVKPGELVVSDEEYREIHNRQEEDTDKREAVDIPPVLPQDQPEAGELNSIALEPKNDCEIFVERTLYVTSPDLL